LKFEKHEIQGVYLIKPELFSDSRGKFRRHFDLDQFMAEGIESKIINANISENPNKFTLSGFHYQIGEYAEAKTLSCLVGEIYDVVVDLRPNSPTYKQWISFYLNSENRFSIHVPAGCANAFLTTTENSLIHYYVSNSYQPEYEKGIRYDDPSFSFNWPNPPVYISDKDLNHPNYSDNSIR